MSYSCVESKYKEIKIIDNDDDMKTYCLTKLEQYLQYDIKRRKLISINHIDAEDLPGMMIEEAKKLPLAELIAATIETIDEMKDHSFDWILRYIIKGKDMELAN